MHRSPALHPTRASTTQSAPWWLGDALSAGPCGLQLDGVPLADLAQQHGTPLYVYSATTLRRRLGELRAALRSTGAPFRIHYAMKANRFHGVLDVVRRESDIGIDACSPREVERALAAGFTPSEISVTAGMLSNRDLVQFAAHGVHLNLDTRSVLRRFAAMAGAGTKVGLRIDPKVRVGWGQEPKLCYGDAKFGFAADETLAAADYARSLGLEVDELHLHAGWGLQRDAAPLLGAAFARLAELSRAIPTVRTLNVGGGLCWRQRPEDEPLTPAAWAELLRVHIAPTGCTIACEPGTFVAASSGILLALYPAGAYGASMASDHCLRGLPEEVMV